MPVDDQQIGLRLRAHRLGSGLSPEEAADRLGVSRAALYNYERGSTPIEVETLERMAEILGVSLPSLRAPSISPPPSRIRHCMAELARISERSRHGSQ